MMRRQLGILAAGALALSTLAGCGGAASEPFELAVVPQQLNGFSIAGQQVVFLVTLAEGASDLAVAITAEASNATATVLEPTLSEADNVAEVVVVPDESSVGGTVGVTITGTRGPVTTMAELAFDVVEGVDDRTDRATELRDMFIPWLASTHPELGITEATEWQGTIVSPQWLVCRTTCSSARSGRCTWSGTS